MQQKTKEFRQELANLFIRALEEKQLDWKKEWQATQQRPMNAKSSKRYKGINYLRLMLVAMEQGYTDPRWATFKQIQDMGYHLKNAKGKGVPVEYWFPYDTKEKKSVSWDEYNLLPSEEKAERYIIRAQYSTVFNGTLIEGLPALPEPEKRHIVSDELIHTLSVNMGVPIENDGGDRAFYRPAEDKIHLPLPEYFFTDNAYNATALHELAHATGHPSRLDRNIRNMFGSEDYAYEELIAEITSCFMSVNLSAEQSESDIDNHMAYVQSWIDCISEKPETLVKAVAEAEKTAVYMEYKAGIIPELEYENVLKSTRETIVESPEPESKEPIPMDLDDYLRKVGLDSPFGPYQDDKMIGHAKVLHQDSTKSDMAKTSEEYWEKRNTAKLEYWKKVDAGELRPCTEIERTLRKAQGHPDNPSVQAARRMAEKRGYDWQTGKKIKV
ncbi:MAG: ArdC family protein [Agathobacter sp.]